MIHIGDMIYAPCNSGADDLTFWADGVSFYWRHIRGRLGHGSVYDPHVLDLCNRYNEAVAKLCNVVRDRVATQ